MEVVDAKAVISKTLLGAGGDVYVNGVRPKWGGEKAAA